MRLTLAAPIEKWDEAIPLGNGLIGGLLWGKGNELRLSLDRGDLWDLRQHPIYARPDFTYATVVARAQAGQADQLNKEIAHSSDYPTKLPGARLVVTLDPKFQANAPSGRSTSAQPTPNVSSANRAPPPFCCCRIRRRSST
jgi:alpha-L-fucosidase 2